MINQDTLTKIAGAVNSRPCPLCGGMHRVNIALNSSHSFAKSSCDWLIFPSGEKVFVEIEDGACDGFKERLTHFLISKIL